MAGLRVSKRLSVAVNVSKLHLWSDWHPVLVFGRAYSAPTRAQIPESKIKYVPTSGIYPNGFRVSGTYVGVKASNTSLPDLALITSEKPCSAAAIFTQHKNEAAPVTVSRQVLQRKQNKDIKSIIINSGCANSVTGKEGFEDAKSMAAALDQMEPNASPNSSLVMSTGKQTPASQRYTAYESSNFSYHWM